MDVRSFARFAIYWTPAPASPWADLAAALFGGAIPPADIDAETWAAATTSPRRYGLHATLKAPFALAAHTQPADLATGLGDFAAAHPAPAPFPLELVIYDAYVALMPAPQAPDLIELAADLVRDLDPYRAPLTPADRARRNADALDPREAELLEAWGYPYVMEQFAFHITLAGPIADTATRERIAAALAPVVAPLIATPFTLDALSLCGDPGQGASFQTLARYPLA